jgi:hypothetical protein
MTRFVRFEVKDSQLWINPATVKVVTPNVRELRAALLTAQSGEARAVEALKRIAEPPGCGCTPICQCRTLESRSIELEAKMDIAAEVVEAAQPALAWLAQREAEAAAEALEDIAKENGTDGGKAYFASVVYREFPDRLTMRIGVVEAGELMMRAAALRAGATGEKS